MYDRSSKLLFLLFFSFSAYGKLSCEHSPTVLRCLTYLDNYDGDTITVHIPDTHPLFGYGMKVRLIGIDTPEIRGSSPCEKKQALYVKDYVRNLLINARSLELKAIARDKYFRVLGDLWFDGKSLGDLLLEKNLAIPYDGGRKPDHDWCQTIKK